MWPVVEIKIWRTLCLDHSSIMNLIYFIKIYISSSTDSWQHFEYSYLYFIDVFRFPCRMGTCETPIDVMTCQLIASKIFPEIVVKALLYPGAIKRFLMEGAAILSPTQLLNSYKFNMRKTSATTDIKQLEVCSLSSFLPDYVFLWFLMWILS